MENWGRGSKWAFTKMEVGMCPPVWEPVTSLSGGQRGSPLEAVRLAASPCPQVRAWLRREALGGRTSAALGNRGQGWRRNWHSICRIFRGCKVSRIISKENKWQILKILRGCSVPNRLKVWSLKGHWVFLRLGFIPVSLQSSSGNGRIAKF